MHDSYDELITRVADELRSPVTLRPDFDARVMAEVRRAARPDWRARLRWFIQPKSVRVSPLVGLAAAAALAGLTVVGTRVLDARRTLSPAGASAEIGTPAVKPASEVVQFVLVAPGASSVALVGDFNDWDATRTPLEPATGAGVWSVNVPLQPGQHQYAFVVNGKDWRPDPAAPRAVTDDFGAPNSVIFVGGKST